MKTLALILLACSAKVGWANDLSKVTTTYIILGGERIAENSFTQWTVAKGSETYTLDEFVKSGKFCEFRGKHMNQIKVGSCQTIFQKCLICGQSITKP